MEQPAEKGKAHFQALLSVLFFDFFLPPSLILFSSLLLILPPSVTHQCFVDRGETPKQPRHKLFFRDSVGLDECDEWERHFIDKLTCTCVCVSD